MSFKKHISVPQPDNQERGYYNKAGNALDAGMTGLSSGAYQQNLMAPYLYNLAGLDVQYDDRSPDLQKATSDRDAAMQNITDWNTATNPAAKKAILAKLASDPAFKEALNKKGVLTKKGAKKSINARLNADQRNIEDISSAPLRIKSITQNAEAAKQAQNANNIEDTEASDLQKSLSSNADDVLAADPALAQELARSKAELQQSQVGQFGDLASAGSGTVGAVQNAAYDQARAAAISGARRENIGLYSGLYTGQRAQNTQVAAAKQGMAALPAGLSEDSATRFGQLAGGYGSLIAGKAGQRQMQFQANSFNQTQPGIGESILKGIGSLMQPFKSNG